MHCPAVALFDPVVDWLTDRVVGSLVIDLLSAPARLGPVRLLAIDGPSGAGKSTLAGSLVQVLREWGCCTRLVPTDHFATWDDPVSWWPRFSSDVLDPLGRGESGRYRRTEWHGGIPIPGEWIDTPVPDVLVVEGVSAGRRSVRDRLSLLVWVELADAAARLARAVARDGETCRVPLSRWQDFERGWFAVDGTRLAADRVIRLLPEDRLG